LEEFFGAGTELSWGFKPFWKVSFPKKGFFLKVIEEPEKGLGRLRFPRGY